MLKQKLAVLMLAAGVFGTAQAQNVTVYGVVDAGVQHYDSGTETITRAGQNLLATSRLGFRGSEDLGGGLKANFQLEMQINPSAGSAGATSPVATNEIFNRESWVGLSGGFGEVRLGRTDMTLMSELDTYAHLSNAGNFGFHGFNGTSVELGQDIKNTVKYISPRIGGFQLQAAHATNDPTATADSDGSKNSFSISYEAGKLKLAVAQQKDEGATKAAERDATGVAAYYDFGFASLGLSHITGDVSTTGDVTSKTTSVSARVPLANNVALFAVYGMTENGAQVTANKGNGYTVGAIKSLSKRTRLYAAYTTVDNEANSSMRMFNTTAPATAGLDTKAISVGMVHSF
jgi:predicted porin